MLEKNDPSLATIRHLDPAVADQIAAGEVVERPGAALKELIENSLDAGANRIAIRIAGGGIDQIEVSDNGKGIHPEELRLALSRYATSKIQLAQDLQHIQTLGFRGEALAAISAVSRVHLNSLAQGQEIGREIICEASRILSERTQARAPGTTIRVENLFANTPARKKFLKSAASETNFCLQIVHRLAMANPQVEFSIAVDGELETFPISHDPRERIALVFRRSLGTEINAQDLLPFARKKLGIAVHGFILPLSHAVKNTRGIFTFVNGRAVKDRVLQQAAIAAAREVSFGGEYPQLVLFLEIDPEMVDVNVHPTKTEVRFREPSPFGFIYKALVEALSFLRLPDRDPSATGQSATYDSALLAAPLMQELVLNIPHSFQQESASTLGAWPEPSPSSPQAFALRPEPQTVSLHDFGPQFLGTLRNTYIVCQEASGLLLVDQHAAHERVTYEKLRATRIGKSPATAPLLIPIAIELDRLRTELLVELLPKLAELGLVLERFGPTQMRVLELPVLLLDSKGAPRVPLANLIRGFAEALQSDEAPEDIADTFQRILLDSLASESCHGSVRAGQNLSRIEAEALLREMRETDYAAHCPHGRPTSIRLSWTDIEKLFKRRI